MRQNLGQLESRGVMVETDLRPVDFLTITAGYQYANSTVTEFQADPTLVGKWTPQVPRNSATAQVRIEKKRWGVLAVDMKASGQQFDDSANMYRLSGYTQIDLYAEHAFGDRIHMYASVQNLFNSRIEAGRTPVLTLAAPRVVAVGLRFH
jgi:outer membrane receptor protein involved in Fe transport